MYMYYTMETMIDLHKMLRCMNGVLGFMNVGYSFRSHLLAVLLPIFVIDQMVDGWILF